MRTKYEGMYNRYAPQVRGVGSNIILLPLVLAHPVHCTRSYTVQVQQPLHQKNDDLEKQNKLNRTNKTNITYSIAYYITV